MFKMLIISRGLTKIQKRFEKVVKASPDSRIRKQSSQKVKDETPSQMNGNGGTVCLLGQEGGRGDGGRGEDYLKEKDGDWVFSDNIREGGQSFDGNFIV